MKNLIIRIADRLFPQKLLKSFVCLLHKDFLRNNKGYQGSLVLVQRTFADGVARFWFEKSQPIDRKNRFGCEIDLEGINDEFLFLARFKADLESDLEFFVETKNKEKIDGVNFCLNKINARIKEIEFKKIKEYPQES